MKLKARYVDVDTGEVTALLHDDDCAELGLREKDRVRLSLNGRVTVAIVTTSDTVINRGEIGLLGTSQLTLEFKDGDLVEVVSASKPESVEFIKRKMDGAELSTEEIKALEAPYVPHAVVGHA